MLEHLEMPPAVAAQNLLELVPVGGHLIVTVPKVYGYHPDPIDNRYRPAPDELAGLFQGHDVLQCTAVRGRSQIVEYARNKGLLGCLTRLLLPLYRPTECVVGKGLAAFGGRSRRRASS